MALYLFIVDSVALLILNNFKPYKSNSDNCLSILLVTVECCVFLSAFLLLSGVTETDNYNEDSMFSALFAIVLTSIFFVVPVTFVLKFEQASRFAQSCLDSVLQFPRRAWQAVAGQKATVVKTLVTPNELEDKSSNFSSLMPSCELSEMNAIVSIDRKK